MDDDDGIIARLEKKLGGPKLAKGFAKDFGLGDDFVDFVEDPLKKKKKKKRKIEDAKPKKKSQAEEAEPPPKKWVPASRSGGGSETLKSRIRAITNRVSERTVETCGMDVVRLYETYPATEVNEALSDAAFVGTTVQRESLGPTYAALVACVHCSGKRDAGCVVLDRIESPFLIACLCEVGLVDGGVAMSLCESLARQGLWDQAALIIATAREALKTSCPDRLARFKQETATTQTKEQQQPRESHYRRVIVETGKSKRSTVDKERWRLLRMAVKRANQGAMPVPCAQNLEWDELRSSRGRWWKRIGLETTEAKAKQSRDLKAALDKITTNDVEELAAKHRMRTRGRRLAFVAVTGARDAEDAYHRCLELGKGADDRDVSSVLIHCCLLEQRYNPFYSAVCLLWLRDKAQKSRSFALKLSIWTALKSLSDYDRRQVANLGKLVVAIHSVLPLTLACAGLPATAALDDDLLSSTFLATVLRAILSDNGDFPFEGVTEKKQNKAPEKTGGPAQQAVSGAEVLLAFLTNRRNLLGACASSPRATTLQDALTRALTDVRHSDT